MKHIFLLNKFSLKDNTSKIESRINDVSKELDLDYKIETNSDIRSTESIINKYKKDRNIIICIGGDGTINRTLNAIVGTKNILGFIPYGTGNDFYRTNKELLESGINKIDLIKINDTYFINVACFGIDADIANNEEVIHSKFIPKSQSYNIGLVKHFLKYKPKHLSVIVDDETYEGDYTTVALCNARYYGGGYKICTNALVDDGLIDIYLVDKLAKINMARLILGMKKGKHELSDSVKVIKSKKVIVKADKEIACNIDGDKLTGDTFNVEVIPKGIEVYYNQELIDKILDVRNKKK